MKLGNKIYLIFAFFCFYLENSIAEDKITSSPLINLEQIKPSFEEFVEEKDNVSPTQNL